MSCNNPIPAFYESTTGTLKVLPRRPDYNIRTLSEQFGDHLVLLPCGKCLGCKRAKAHEWAVRCVLESKYHKDNCFLTLTYEEETEANKKDFQDFLKRLRKRTGADFKFFACGELGEKTHRFHYHCLLFGYKPSDMLLWSNNNGNPLFTSKFINSVWKHGFVIIGDVSEASACYTAAYTSKKYGDDGFLMMSRRPGLGTQYFLDNREEISRENKIILKNGSIANLPRFYKNKIKDWSPSRYEELIKMNQLKALNVINDSVSNYEEILQKREDQLRYIPRKKVVI